MTAQIIKFPKRNPRIPARTAQEINRDLFEARCGLAEHLTDEIMSDAYAMMTNLNVPISMEDDSVKSMGFLQESIKAAIPSMWGIKHPFHNIADKIFTIENDHEGDRILKLQPDAQKKATANTAKK